MAAAQVSPSPAPFMGPFYYSHMLASSPECSLSDSNGSSPAAETPGRTRVDWTKEETIILLDTWSCVYESLKSAFPKESFVGKNPAKFSKQMLYRDRGSKSALAATDQLADENSFFLNEKYYACMESNNPYKTRSCAKFW